VCGGLLRDFAVMNEVYAEFFGDAIPARTTAKAFATPGIGVESTTTARCKRVGYCRFRASR
jgi:enamine deaminase RidA (YjgF/YER057c/UK114 family)